MEKCYEWITTVLNGLKVLQIVTAVPDTRKSSNWIWQDALLSTWLRKVLQIKGNVRFASDRTFNGEGMFCILVRIGRHVTSAVFVATSTPATEVSNWESLIYREILRIKPESEQNIPNSGVAVAMTEKLEKNAVQPWSGTEVNMINYLRRICQRAKWPKQRRSGWEVKHL